ncbi:hypothetical protein HELRODRAFT_192853 [Helobdella robusta]|uniref:Uncharacterized protein n=1 Tax=Helobdella robusta TaxID=6412 RepID=T1FUD0_HELRO|nr:hypothetical protein HELRODRAFT_192853 [Helobdella robusta]ESN99544.1 hypothetical protein HELRODRAFT_192853 [Helobdella robusta]
MFNRHQQRQHKPVQRRKKHLHHYRHQPQQHNQQSEHSKQNQRQRQNFQQKPNLPLHQITRELKQQQQWLQQNNTTANTDDINLSNNIKNTLSSKNSTRNKNDSFSNDNNDIKHNCSNTNINHCNNNLPDGQQDNMKNSNIIADDLNVQEDNIINDGSPTKGTISVRRVKKGKRTLKVSALVADNNSLTQQNNDNDIVSDNKHHHQEQQRAPASHKGNRNITSTAQLYCYMNGHLIDYEQMKLYFLSILTSQQNQQQTNPTQSQTPPTNQRPRPKPSDTHQPIRKGQPHINYGKNSKFASKSRDYDDENERQYDSSLGGGVSQDKDPNYWLVPPFLIGASSIVFAYVIIHCLYTYCHCNGNRNARNCKNNHNANQNSYNNNNNNNNNKNNNNRSRSNRKPTVRRVHLMNAPVGAGGNIAVGGLGSNVKIRSIPTHQHGYPTKLPPNHPIPTILFSNNNNDETKNDVISTQTSTTATTTTTKTTITTAPTPQNNASNIPAFLDSLKDCSEATSTFGYDNSLLGFDSFSILNQAHRRYSHVLPIVSYSDADDMSLTNKTANNTLNTNLDSTNAIFSPNANSDAFNSIAVSNNSLSPNQVFETRPFLVFESDDDDDDNFDDNDDDESEALYNSNDNNNDGDGDAKTKKKKSKKDKKMKSESQSQSRRKSALLQIPQAIGRRLSQTRFSFSSITNERNNESKCNRVSRQPRASICFLPVARTVSDPSCSMLQVVVPTQSNSSVFLNPNSSQRSSILIADPLQQQQQQLTQQLQSVQQLLQFQQQLQMQQQQQQVQQQQMQQHFMLGDDSAIASNTTISSTITTTASSSTTTLATSITAIPTLLISCATETSLNQFNENNLESNNFSKDDIHQDDNKMPQNSNKPATNSNNKTTHTNTNISNDNSIFQSSELLFKTPELDCGQPEMTK